MKAAHEIIRAVAAGTETHDDMEWLRARLGDYCQSPEAGLERALWLDRAPGEAPWWTLDRRARRDDLLRRLAAILAPDSSPWSAADVLAAFVRRYMASAWLVDQLRAAPPEDKAKSLAWEALKLECGMPGGRRQLHDILRTGRTTAKAA